MIQSTWNRYLLCKVKCFDVNTIQTRKDFICFSIFTILISRLFIYELYQIIQKFKLKKIKTGCTFLANYRQKNADVIIGHASRIICSSVLFCRPHIQIRIWKAYFYSGMLRLEICAEHTSRHCWGLTNLTFGSIEKALKMDTKFLSYGNLSNNERCDCTTHIHVITFNTRIALFGNAFWVHFVTPTS